MERFKKICLIVYIVLLAGLIYGLTGFSFWQSHVKGWDFGDTAMGLFFFAVPLGLAIIFFLYSLLTADVKKMVIIFLVMFAPWIFIQFVDGWVLEIIYGAGALVIGAIGWLINTCVIEPKMDMRFRRKMDRLGAEEKTPEE